MMRDLTAPMRTHTPALALRPAEAAAAIGVSERKLFQLTKEKRIPHARLGGCVVYPVAELQQWLSSLAEHEKSPALAGDRGLIENEAKQ